MAGVENATLATSTITDKITLTDPLHDLLLNPLYIKLALTAVGVFIAGYLTWIMYIKLANKNILNLKVKSGSFSSIGAAVWYITQYGIIFPIFSFVWFVAFVACLYFLSSSYTIDLIMFIGVVLIAAIRLFAYVNEKLSEDFAKLLPLTMLAAILINPAFVKTMGSSWAGLLDGIISVTALQYLIFIVLLEFVLQALYLVKIKITGETVEDDAALKRHSRKNSEQK